MIRILVADDQAMVREGLRLIIDAQDDMQVVGEAGDGRAALDAVDDLDPDVVLMDIRMPGLDGIAATDELTSRRPGRPRVIILTTYGLDENVYAALRAGAAGFFVKTDVPTDLVAAVRAVDTQDAALGSDVVRRLVQRFVAGPPPNLSPPPEVQLLTEREQEVMVLVGQGLSNAEIAQRLYVGDGTVKTHVARVLAKLGLRDRVQVVVYCYEHGLIRPGATGSDGG